MARSGRVEYDDYDVRLGCMRRLGVTAENVRVCYSLERCEGYDSTVVECIACVVARARLK